jgi:lysozyme
MRIDTAGRDFIYKQEGVRLKAYYDVASVATIGVGMTYYPATGKNVKIGDTISLEQCDSMFTAMVNSYEDAVIKAVKVPLTQNQFNALVSFTYNVGIGNATKGFLGSTLLKRVNAKASADLIKAAFLMWIKAGGKVVADLKTRRTLEADLFNKA